ncbi:MAG: hypothetical protein IJI03_12220 [Rudaea sp.]|uniref:hypothetical protein n=1 Tax=Rudaea sp. 3F27F6 TaxID=2502208 RepID=UPI0010F9E551|nr:hypothetical protein [Rudaea sp. 3F27F6]MBR0346012.1 hypothetical protein [Rudaea sp.]
MTTLSKIYPSYTVWLKFSAKTLTFLFTFLLASVFVVDLIKGGSLPNAYTVAILVAALLLVTAALALLLYGVFRASAWSMSREGLRGRSFWGRRTEIPWSKVSKVSPFSMHGIPGFVAGSDSKREVYACVLGLDLNEVHSRLILYAGAQHPLTKLFERAA